MKNIHVLPTDKPSRLVRIYSDVERNNFTIKLGTKVNDSFKEYVNNNITSDEPIKDGDWFLTDDKRVEKCAPDWKAREWHKKIILTTDKDLIKDGVQAIDDEFLEWFVKNPSCEKVEIANDLKYFNVDELRERHLKGLPHLYSESIGYKIIIPKEESKQETLEKYSERFDNDESAIGNPETWGKRVLTEEDIFNQRDIDAVTDYIGKETSKQKTTLEEAAEKYSLQFLNQEENKFSKEDFINGAKWQQERSYSEEEVIKILLTFRAENPRYINLWFEQFKNK